MVVLRESPRVGVKDERTATVENQHLCFDHGLKVYKSLDSDHCSGPDPGKLQRTLHLNEFPIRLQ
jgi:hypothetical protein